MAKKVLDPKAKEKKQKKIAIVGFVLLLALGAYQGPKTMKLLNPGPPPQSTPAPASAAPAAPGVTPTPATPSAPAAGGSAPTGLPPSAVDGLVVNADLSPVALDGQLAALTQFTSKDPFKQQVISTTSSPSGSTSTPTTTTPAPPTSSGGSFTPAPGTTTPTSGPTTPKPAPTVATISVNGVEMAVPVKTDFPADSPFFQLVSLTATTAKIGIAGGSLATGSPTVTLKKGKAVTLMNTADGTRYILVLVSMGDTTTPPAASTGGTSTTPGTTTGASTSTTPTTP